MTYCCCDATHVGTYYAYDGCGCFEPVSVETECYYSIPTESACCVPVSSVQLKSKSKSKRFIVRGFISMNYELIIMN